MIQRISTIAVAMAALLFCAGCDHTRHLCAEKMSLEEQYERVCRLIPPGTQIAEVSKRMGGDGRLTVQRKGSSKVLGWKKGSSEVWGWTYDYDHTGGFSVTFDSSPLEGNWWNACVVSVGMLKYGGSTSDDRAFRKALAVWHQPAAGIMDKLAAVEVVAKHDATAAGLKKLLDSSQCEGYFSTRSGLVPDTCRGRLVYDCPDRCIFLYFDIPSRCSLLDEWRYNHAELGWSLPHINWTVATGGVVNIE